MERVRKVTREHLVKKRAKKTSLRLSASCSLQKAAIVKRVGMKKWYSQSKKVCTKPHSPSKKKNTDVTTGVTGEEDEITVFHGRGKLWHRVDAEWKERGPGVFKLNVNKETGGDPRIGTLMIIYLSSACSCLSVMRRDGALNILINSKLFQGMTFTSGPDPRYVTFAVLDDALKPKSHLLRVNDWFTLPYYYQTHRIPVPHC